MEESTRQGSCFKNPLNLDFPETKHPPSHTNLLADFESVHERLTKEFCRISKKNQATGGGGACGRGGRTQATPPEREEGGSFGDSEPAGGWGLLTRERGRRWRGPGTRGVGRAHAAFQAFPLKH